MSEINVTRDSERHSRGSVFSETLNACHDGFITLFLSEPKLPFPEASIHSMLF